MSYRHQFVFALAAAIYVSQALSTDLCAEDRSIDGTGNNLANPDWGSAGTNFGRLAPVGYRDGTSEPDVLGPSNPRSISSALFRQSASRPSRRRLSGYVYAFGQFLTHDIQESVSGTSESIEFRIPAGDDIYPPGLSVPLTRSVFDAATGTGPDNPRQQVNFATGFIDGSQIYASDEETASILLGGPANAGAKLRTSNDVNGDGQNLLPRDAFGPAPDAVFVAGDSRVNDNIPLTSLHTLFMREHNRLVDELAAEHPTWSDDELYQRARKFVGAQLQVITYNEFLPALLGPHAPRRDGHYDPELNPSVLNEFPTVFLRVGHSMLPDEFKRVQNDGRPAPEGHLPLVDAFFAPSNLTESTDLDLFLKGLSVEIQEETDLKLVDGMRVALLGAIDIQRGRDHGIPDYNTVRDAYGLPRVLTFEDMSSDVEVQQALAAVYEDVDSIDPFVGALAEDHLPGASVGPLIAAGFREQFNRLKGGDRFWYENDAAFSPEDISLLRNTRLSDIILRNTGVTNLRGNVFFVPEPGTFAILVALLPVLIWGARESRRR